MNTIAKNKANKCSICGQGFDNLEDLIVHEAVHDAGPEDELDADYVGGHIKFKNKMHTTLKLGDHKIDVTPFESNEPSFSIPYKRIIAVDVLSNRPGSSFAFTRTANIDRQGAWASIGT